MRSIPYPHPGEVLKHEFLDPLGISAYRLAKAIDVQQTRIGEIIAGSRGISTDTGLRLSRFFGVSDGFWTRLQLDYDTAQVLDARGEELAKIERWDARAA